MSSAFGISAFGHSHMASPMTHEYA